MTERPPTVPADAEFDAKENLWKRGARLPNGESVGAWIGWLPGGELALEAHYDDLGRLQGLLRRWHPSGELAQWATFEKGRVHGVYVWTRPSHGPADSKSRLPPNAPDRVVRMDVPYHRGVVQPAHFTFHLTREGRIPQDADGRTHDLAAHAHLFDVDSTLLPVAPAFGTVDGTQIGTDLGDRWVYQGPTEGGFRVQRYIGRATEMFAVPPAELSRAFTLSAPYFVAWLESRRPAGVPEGALFERNGGLWELGEFAGSHRIGEWRTWRADGSLRARQRWVAGALDGPFERFHPDGSPAWTGAHARGERVGALTWTRGPAETDEAYTNTLGDAVTRVVEDLTAEVVTYARADGSPCNVHGVPLAEAWRDDRFDVPPEDFLPSGFGRYLDDHHPRVQADLDEVSAGWAAYWGAPMHPELQALVRELADHDLPNLFEWCTDLSIPCPDEDGQNWFENLVREDQAHHRGWQLPQAFGGLLRIGTLGNGDGYHVSVFEPMHDPSGRGQVYLFDHDEGAFQAPFAIDLSRFTYLAALGDACRTTESVSREALARGMARLEGQVAPSWHWNTTLARAGAEAMEVYDSPAPNSQYFAWMSRWIIALLRGDVDDARAYFDPNFFPAEGDWAPRLVRIPREVPLALYWSWRLYFFGDDARLDQVLAVMRTSASRLIRDAALTLDLLRSGWTELGEVEDMPALRAAFQALDLHPDRAAARERAAQEAEAERARQQAAAEARVAATPPAGLGSLAWASLDDPHVLTAVGDVLRGDPSMARTWERLDALVDLRQADVDAVLRGLARDHDPRLVPLVVGSLRCGAPEIPRAREVLGALCPISAARELLPLLAREETYHHTQLVVLDVLGAARLQEAVPALLRNLELPADVYAHREVVPASVRALGRIGGPEASAALVGLLRGRLGRQAAAACADARALEAFSALVDLIPERASPEVLWALATLAPEASVEARAEALARIQVLTPSEAHLWALRAHALRALGGEAHDLNRWARTAMALTSYSEEPSIANKVWGLQIGGLHDDVALDELHPWARHEHPELRDAALAALALRGAPTRIVEHDVVSVRALDRDACLTALRDPDVVGRAAVVRRLAELEDPTVGGALLAAVREALTSDRPTHDGADAPDVLVALIGALREGGFDAERVAACLACLATGVRRLVDPAIRNPPPVHPDLVGPLAAVERRESGWMARNATAWLDAYPDAEAVARARQG